MIREANPMGAALDELTKDNPLLGLIMSHVKLPEITPPSLESMEAAPQIIESSQDAGFTPGKIGK